MSYRFVAPPECKLGSLKDLSRPRDPPKKGIKVKCSDGEASVSPLVLAECKLLSEALCVRHVEWASELVSESYYPLDLLNAWYVSCLVGHERSCVKFLTRLLCSLSFDAAKLKAAAAKLEVWHGDWLRPGPEVNRLPIKMRVTGLSDPLLTWVQAVVTVKSC